MDKQNIFFGAGSLSLMAGIALLFIPTNHLGTLQHAGGAVLVAVSIICFYKLKKTL